MTTERQLTEPSTNSVTGPSIHVLRARKLLYGGLTGGVAATIICLVLFGVFGGSAGLAGAALASAMVLFFYAAGQYVMVRFADAGSRTLLAVSMASYTTRIVLLGLLLLIFQQNKDSWPTVAPMAVFVTTMAVVAGWLAVEVFTFSRLRITHVDTEYQPVITARSDQ